MRRSGRRTQLALGLAVAVVNGDLRAPRGRSFQGVVALGVEGLGTRIRDRDLDTIATGRAASRCAVAATWTTVATVILARPASVYPQCQPLLVEPASRRDYFFFLLISCSCKYYTYSCTQELLLCARARVRSIPTRSTARTMIT